MLRRSCAKDLSVYDLSEGPGGVSIEVAQVSISAVGSQVVADSDETSSEWECVPLLEGSELAPSHCESSVQALALQSSKALAPRTLTRARSRSRSPTLKEHHTGVYCCCSRNGHSATSHPLHLAIDNCKCSLGEILELASLQTAINSLQERILKALSNPMIDQSRPKLKCCCAILQCFRDDIGGFCNCNCDAKSAASTDSIHQLSTQLSPAA